MRFRKAFGVFAAGCATLAAGIAPAQEWKPGKNVEIVVASAAGGSSDRTARVLQRLLQANAAFPSVSVNNRAGGGGTVAWTYLAQRAPDAHFIATFSPTLLTNQILRIGTLSHQDFTPLSILLREYPVVTVNADSPVTSGKVLLERIRKDPASLSFAFASSVGNHNHVIIGMIFKAAGVDPGKAKVVIEKSGASAMTAVLGGHIDVLVGAPANALPHVEAGKARILGITAPQRQAGRLAALPTFREQGIDAVFFSWRGFIGPKGMTPPQISFWDQAFAKAIQGEDWKQDVEKNAWAEDYMPSAETRRHLESEYELMSKMLADLGVLTKQ